MFWKEYTSISEFARYVSPLLLKKEAANNLPLGLINNMIIKGKGNEVLTATVEDRHKVYASFIMTPPHHLVVTLDEHAPTQDVISIAVQALKGSSFHFPSVIGERTQVTLFAEEWEKTLNCSYSIDMEQRIYQLHTVKDIKESLGEHSLAKPEDLPLLTNWLLAFIEDTGLVPEREDKARASMEEKVNTKSIYLWKVNDQPVAMTGKGRQSENGRVVNMVYTPPELRGNGYASSLVKKVSEEILKEKSFCTLYTDLANPTSNKIYTQIGYEPIEDSLVIRFD